MKEYIKQQLEKLGKWLKTWRSLDGMKLIVPRIINAYKQSLVRFTDTAGFLFNVSRQRSKEMIESGKAKVNPTEENRPDFMLEILDIVSIRG